jgi:hypothetical protein
VIVPFSQAYGGYIILPSSTSGSVYSGFYFDPTTETAYFGPLRRVYGPQDYFYTPDYSSTPGYNSPSYPRRPWWRRGRNW